MRDLDRYFCDSVHFGDISTNPYFLGHIAELGWLTNETILDYNKSPIQFIPTENWKRRGEVSIALIMIYLNIRYNRADHFRHSDMLNQLFPRVQIAICTQFWRFPRFASVEGGKSLDYFNALFDASNTYYDNEKMLGVNLGVSAQRLEENETDAMIRFSGYCQGLINEFLK